MELWGAALYGDPCRDCQFDWRIDMVHAVTLVAASPAEIDRRSGGAVGGERWSAEGWSVAEYVSHMADNLRNWAERVQGARLAGVTDIAGYDQDELARVRRYDRIPLAAARWALGISAPAWVDVMRSALAEGVVVHHATRGEQRAADIVRNNAHDVWHHLWDIDRALGQSAAAGVSRPG
ncbi:maleylpyruvate isomerase N-terminal domain-containing protein [Parafrankia sp. EUN1f]|uniref:maleylpyruvate isomerase N-terminal domain-containing protein n=1 Tax=Parafrankia sp. EUN1f TaxID=102897 RepID=UPI0001C44A32|nr:maleylpyruvate isomerase N-terminal domain-containing protein [Parafrankia sp. EUN1f]EFC85061.1 hypothetical protein FrEUN1fDRAFT_1847 [Parafrankia sp. EUN1f]